jgi:imidazolonepropionase-like amidohydrolase
MKKYKKYISLVVAICFTGIIRAQDVPTPAPAQSAPVLLKNATVHTGNGQVLQNTSVLFDNGKIVQIGVGINAPSGTKEMDLTGKHIYPGLVATNTTLGLDEIEAVRATRDNREPGKINPNMKALVAYNTDSRVTPTVRSNGVLVAQVVPSGELFSGTSCVVQLDAWNWEDAAYLADDGVHLFWPGMSLSQSPLAPPLDEQKKNRADRLSDIDVAMNQSRNYWMVKKAGTVKDIDQRWEAMIPVLEKKRPIYIHADGEKEISAAIAFSLRHEVRIVIVGGADCWRVVDLLKAHRIPVILQETHAVPQRADDPIDIASRLPKILLDAGVPFCISKDGFWDTRNLPFVAGTAVAHGLTKEEALRSITLSAAEILGIADKCGSVETGKDANLLITAGDLLDMRTATVEVAFIQGRQIDLGNKQKDLYKKFRNR